MSAVKINVISIIALIVGASGLGIGTFATVRFQVITGPEGPEGPEGLPGTDGLNGTDGLDGINGTLDNLVAVWESVSGSGVSYNLSLNDIQVNNSDYFSLTDNNESIHLLEAGWYRFMVRVLWMDLTVGTDTYWLYMQKNGIDTHLIDRVYQPVEEYYFVKTFSYVYSDGSDVIHLNCRSISHLFGVYFGQDFNQITLEYVGE